MRGRGGEQGALEFEGRYLVAQVNGGESGSLRRQRPTRQVAGSG